MEELLHIFQIFPSNQPLNKDDVTTIESTFTNFIEKYKYYGRSGNDLQTINLIGAMASTFLRISFVSLKTLFIVFILSRISKTFVCNPILSHVWSFPCVYGNGESSRSVSSILNVTSVTISTPIIILSICRQKKPPQRMM